ncbi:initiator tRNA phosphoribosyl transferase [Desarmillaria tabescens]|uniref:Initiator tRNA phosphoribosyl transferase n=1 Tax=Armillaria tabescens TaxID=1929756 RepID=A0AA39KE34_ARMTA|nr:initiator tRNA phosphoribosyl transferase [Desarmillaria tabescens]KAK0459297.1 initiator tRNA phosphoribosyl transferase [Desarmillaria tabescens]
MVWTDNFKSTRNAALSYIRKESLDIYNRLHSIDEDITFVNQILPILPNLRCGAWYTDPSTSTSIPAYFKSTDGHFSNWSFNLRRPNLHLLALVEEQKGMILVDSTRAGKKIPDALSKTVPIWCAVVNRAMRIRHPEITTDWDTNLYTPPSTVSSQEHDQIVPLLDGWAEALAKSSYALPQLQYPLRPMWITPSTSSFPQIGSDAGFYPIICVSASKQVEDGLERRSSGFSYIQGSGDDHEAWGMGLVPDIFWSHKAELLLSSQTELQSLVTSIVAASPTQMGEPPTILTKVGSRLAICQNSGLPSPSLGDDFVYLVLSEDDIHIGGGLQVKRIKTLPGKKGQNQFLSTVLPQAMSFVQSALAEGRSVCVSCDTGKDVSVGVVVTALQMFFDDNGHFAITRGPRKVDKHSIRTRLEWIISERPQANPSRSTLKRVNEFLLSPEVTGRHLTLSETV